MGWNDFWSLRIWMLAGDFFTTHLRIGVQPLTAAPIWIDLSADGATFSGLVATIGKYGPSAIIRTNCVETYCGTTTFNRPKHSC